MLQETGRGPLSQLRVKVLMFKLSHKRGLLTWHGLSTQLTMDTGSPITKQNVNMCQYIFFRRRSLLSPTQRRGATGLRQPTFRSRAQPGPQTSTARLRARPRFSSGDADWRDRRRRWVQPIRSGIRVSSPPLGAQGSWPWGPAPVSGRLSWGLR